MSARLEGKKLLVVDDNPGDLETIRIHLSEEPETPFDIVTASSQAEAVEAFQRESFDAVLLDLGLPDAVGLSALNKLSEIRPSVPVIMLTGNSDSKTSVSALKEGALDYLCKDDLSPGYLRHALISAIDRSQYSIENKNLLNELSSISKAVPGVLYRFSVDKNGAYSFPFVSEKFFDLYGVAKDDDRDWTEKFFSNVVEEDVAKLEASIQAVIENHSDWSMVYRIDHAEKGIRWLEATSKFTGADENGSLNWSGIVIDRTEEQEQKEELNKLFWATERTDTAIVITDQKGIATWVNSGFEKLSGYSKDELVGSKLGELLQGSKTDPKSRKYLSEMRRSGNAFQVELLNYHKSGIPYWVFLDVKPVYDDQGNHTGFVGLQSDITERKVREDELARTAKLLKTAAEISGVGAWEYNIITGEIVFSDQTKAIHEIDDDFELTLESALDFYPPEARQEVKTRLDRSVKEGEFYHFEVPFITAKGRELIVESRGIPWVKDGRTERVLGAFRDVTELRKNENELQLAKEKAEAANLAKSQFLDSMSHEIRTPLNAILGLTQILQEDPECEDLQDFLQTIFENGSHLAELISDILDFSKIEANEFELHEEIIELEVFVSKTASLVRQFAMEKGLSLEVTIAEDMCDYYRGDKLRLRQILINLLRNAIKFTHQGEIHLSVQKESDDQLSFSVIDTGIGIPVKEQSVIFDVFHQVDSSNTRNFEGTGLGLAICHRITERMGGTIKLTSVVGEGSTFTVTLPMKPSITHENKQEQQTEAGRISEKPSSGKARALVVDDNLVNAKVLTHILKREGLSVETVDGGMKAIDICQKEKFSVVFMDLQMPEMDGLEATRVLKSNISYGSPYIVMVSASVKNNDLQNSLTAGANEFLPKPVKLADLRNILSKIVQ